LPADLIPPDGEVQLESVRLPAGRRVYPHSQRGGSTPPIAWLTTAAVDEPGAVWSALSAISGQTGLIPFLAGARKRWSARSWYIGGFPLDQTYPQDVSPAADLDVAAILKGRWDSQTQPELGDDSDEEDEERFREWRDARIAPYTRMFPGLAPASSEPADPEQVRHALGALPPARIGLAAADRSADVLAAVGWYPGNWENGLLPVVAVARSWEERFGASLLEIGINGFRLLASRPARSLEEALPIAAEQWAFAYECWPGQEVGLSGVSEIADHLVNIFTWGFWWD
jgi:hypothetical protein